MKKCVSLCLLLALFAGFPAAYADILWTPDNAFYETHADDCVSHSRSYLANSPEGAVTLYDAPGGTAVGQVKNGGTLWVSFLYQDWGCATDNSGQEPTIGWCPLAELAVIYDSYSFSADYGRQFRTYHGEFCDYSGPLDGVVLWEYPGAPEPKEVWKISDDQFREEVQSPDFFSNVFTDEDGRRWGHAGYLFGYRNFWICLDAPLETDLPVRKIPEVSLYPAKSSLLPASLRLPALLTLGVVGFTAGLLFGSSWKKRRKEKP